ncbi:M48 family metalloprotease [Pseudomonas nitroreducens]|uniref:M48 family metalloprotease n=1 Tax=Pseudomonas nitroreducens TaxID=46680 RepID=UPI0028B1E22F|nr:M48 family metalloprotease [Pseudomonas nitroreducens]
MNFFEHQDRARKQTGRLVLLLTIAVVCLVTLTSLALGWLWRHLGEPALHLTSRASLPDPELYLSVAAVIVGVVVLGALYKQVQLSAGGKVVAESLGGRLLNLSASNADERRLLNVVEEMALASGSPVPPVYVLEDGSINAFAAGLTPRDAVIGITRGAIEQLDRNELQGVIAHEFSHIHHGDMLLNTRLTALLHGMLLLGLIGGMLLRGWSETSTGVRISSRSSSNDKNGGGSVVLLVIGAGVVLYVLGYVGTFFGQLIKASVSRQREFLADASAVQFTRDPSTIAGALKKIGGNPLGALLSAPRAAEFSHMYFGDGVGSSWFDTHPPLKDRIRRVDPGWDGNYPKFEPRLDVALMNKQAWTSAVTGQPYQPSAVDVAVAAVGAPTIAHLQEARSTLQRLDERLQRAAHDSEGAEALVYGLLLDSDPGLRARQLEAIKQRLNLSLALQLDLLEESLLRPGHAGAQATGRQGLPRPAREHGATDQAGRQGQAAGMDAAAHHRAQPAAGQRQDRQRGTGGPVRSLRNAAGLPRPRWRNQRPADRAGVRRCLERPALRPPAAAGRRQPARAGDRTEAAGTTAPAAEAATAQGAGALHRARRAHHRWRSGADARGGGYPGLPDAAVAGDLKRPQSNL